ncbi:shikimate kinase [Rurimicrobium arvi]|uniref:Shikimate kinase n=1 Tax=Rurimicrobium arvi TaxID=2049916 RepID=A0ABP8N1P4_9BACT
MQQVKHYRIVFLTGMPGSGKSYWSRQLAAHHGLAHTDLDKELEQRTGLTPPVFFEQYGEAAFREEERMALNALIARERQDIVVACGGGTPCFFDNMQRMKDNGVVVFVHPPRHVLIRHLEEEQHLRPLLRGGELEAVLDALWERRAADYRQAHFQIEGRELSLADFEPVMAAALL